MEKVITYNFSQNFLANLADYLVANFLRDGQDLSEITVVFGGKRPGLFLKRELAQRIKGSFYPPRIFSIDEFVSYIVKEKERYRRITDIDAAYLIYNLARQVAPAFLEKRENFVQFFPWAREIVRFIDELDLEAVPAESLTDVEMSATIGYPVPESINHLLRNIVTLRDTYHRVLREKHLYSRGFLYLTASESVSEVKFSEFEKILLANFFYLHKTEERIIKDIYERDKAILVFQKDNNEWSTLDRLSRRFSCRIEPLQEVKSPQSLNIYKGFDTHSQVGLVRTILKGIDKPANTVVVLPEAESLIPLLSEIAASVNDFNVSLGYPLKRGLLYGFLENIFKAQNTRKEGSYYTRTYLRVLTHPLMKNLMVGTEPAVTRVLVHKIEEILSGIEPTELSGRLFINLNEMENQKELYPLALAMLEKIDSRIGIQELARILQELHNLAFYSWEKIKNFSDFSQNLEQFLDIMVKDSLLRRYPLNLKIVEKILNIKEELANAEFSQQEFNPDEIFKIFLDKISGEIVSLTGSPLKGLQILGLLETRSLNFENVIVMDVNESILPRLKTVDSLIPREIMVQLGLNRLEQEEDIQRYHFQRLIASARKVYLIYDDSQDKEKSRFIEEIIWEKQKETGTLKVLPQPQALFNVEVLPQRRQIKKSGPIVKFLSGFTFSPSSIDTYLACPFQFYYRYGLNLRANEDFLNEPAGKDIGNFLHLLFQEAFAEFWGKRPVIDTGFRKKFFRRFNQDFSEKLAKRLGSEAFLVKSVMNYRLERFLAREKKRPVKEIVSLEDENYGGAIKLAGKEFQFKIKIDRIDQLDDGSILIIDYKTGGDAMSPNLISQKNIGKFEQMELNRKNIRQRIKSFQLPLYFYFLRKKFPQKSLNAVLYNLRTTELTYLFDDAVLDRVDRLLEMFLKGLEYIVKEIIDPAQDFAADESPSRNCQYCPYFYLCR